MFSFSRCVQCVVVLQAEGDEELLYEPEGDEADVGDVGEG